MTASRALAALVALMLAACGSSDDGATYTGEVALPPLPYEAREGLVVSEASLDDAASHHCGRSRGAADAVRFLLDDLPFDAIDSVCASPTTCEGCEDAMGDLYVSGYFGGIWLRDALDDDAPAGGGAGAAALQALAPVATEIGVPPTGFDAAMLGALAASADRMIDIATTGSDAEVLAQAHSSVPFLLALFGYNRGYLERALESPPPGQPPLEPLVCDDLLGCSRNGRDLEALDRVRGALPSLETPPNERWQEMAEQVEVWGESTVASGREVWDDILSDSGIAPEAYEALAEVSAGYLLVSEAAVLASMQGWADENVDVARCGLLVRAGLVTWSGSYFMGLASPAGPGTFPDVTCTAE